MKKITLLFVLIVVAVSCSSKKEVERDLRSGNYNHAITKAIKKLRTNKDAKRKQDYILLLKNAYDKANERDLHTINAIKTDGNSEYLKQIFETYTVLDNRQKAIKPLLPLAINGKEVNFDILDYNSKIATAKDNVSKYYYKKGKQQLSSPDKYQSRDAYNTFAYIDRINPNYKDIRNLMQEAHFNGTAHVIVTIENKTQQVIPKRLEDALLDFNTYGLDQFWTAYYANKKNNITFDYAMQLQLARINISPEQIREREFIREKSVKDGWQYKLDGNGNVMKDSLGNDIKEDKFINARARLLQFEQFKEAQIIANVVFSDLKTQQRLEQFNIDSGFIFENFYATFRGDRRALNIDDRDLIRNRAIAFPTNEQMIFDSGEDLKLKLKDIISDYKL